VKPAAGAVAELTLPYGGLADGPGTAAKRTDLSADGPGGARFVYLEDRDLEPKEEGTALLTRVPGPGEAGFVPEIQKNVYPGEVLQEKQGRAAGKEKAKIKK